MTLFLDNCCLSRPTDDQTQLRIRQEAQAVLEILRQVEHGHHLLLASSYLLVEIRRNPDLERQHEVLQSLMPLATIIRASAEIESRARLLESLGLRTYDALHVAASEHAHADCLITTDDKLLNFALRHANILTVRVLNPLAWLNFSNT